MPILSLNYGTLASDVTARTRAFLNDMLNYDTTGFLFADDQPYVLPFLNSAVDIMQNRFIDTGYEAVQKEWIMYNVPPAANQTDPNAVVTISFTGTNNGAGNQPDPRLPIDCAMPLNIWVKQYGSNQPWSLSYAVGTSLPPRGTPSFNMPRWNWIQNTLQLNSYLLPLDIKMLYSVEIPEITDLSQFIPVLNCTEALANYCASKFLLTRGGSEESVALSNAYKLAGDIATDTIINKSLKRRQGVPLRRRRPNFWV